jgi:hypothetical protein
MGNDDEDISNEDRNSLLILCRLLAGDSESVYTKAMRRIKLNALSEGDCNFGFSGLVERMPKFELISEKKIYKPDDYARHVLARMVVDGFYQQDLQGINRNGDYDNLEAALQMSSHFRFIGSSHHEDPRNGCALRYVQELTPQMTQENLNEILASSIGNSYALALHDMECCI